MAIISGKEAKLGLVSTSAWGTETEVDKLLAFDSFNFGVSHSVLESASVNGLNQIMAEDLERGATTITPSVTLKLRSGGNWEYLLAQFMGTAGAPSEQNNPQGDYLHTLTLNTSANPQYLSLCVKDASATTFTYPSVAVTGVNIGFSEVPGVLLATFTMIADAIDLSSSTNTVSIMNALSAPTTAPLVVDADDELLVNAQSGGALSNSTDCVSHIAFSIDLQRPQQSFNEVKCAPGNAEPSETGLFTCAINITERGQSDHTIIQRGIDGDYIKLSFDNQSTTQIGSGDYHQFKVKVPKAKIVEEPSYDITGPGFNQISYKYDGLVAASNPTEFSSTYPYFELINEISTDLLA